MSEQTRPTHEMARIEDVVFNALFAKRIADRCTVTAGVALGWAREVVAALDREGLLVTVVPGENLEAAYEAGWREAVTGIVDRLRGEAEGRRLMWLGAGLSPPPEAQIRELHMVADLIEREFGTDEEDGDD